MVPPASTPDEQYLDFSDRLYTQSYLAEVPTHGQFELTFRCPLKCTFCYCTCYTSPEYTRNELTTAQVITILDQAAEAGCLWMTLSGGDPFIRPDFRQIYDHCVKLGFITSIFASGLIVTDDWIEHFRNYPPFKLELPLYGVTANTYEAVSGKKNTFGRAVSNIKKLINAGISVRIKSKILKTNVAEIEQLKLFVEQELGLEFEPYYFLYARLDGSTDHLENRLSPLQIRILEEKFGSLGCDSSTQAQTSDETNPKLFRCAAGVNSFYINPYGEMNFCTYVRTSSYDLKSGTLRDGVKKLKQELLTLTRSADDSCTSCSIQSTCSNCPGHAVVETGSMFGRSEYLCQTNQVLRGGTL